MDCSQPGSSVHGILQARILEWVAIPFSRGSSWPRDRTRVSCPAGRLFTIWATSETPFLSCGLCHSSLITCHSSSICVPAEWNQLTSPTVPAVLAVDFYKALLIHCLHLSSFASQESAACPPSWPQVMLSRQQTLSPFSGEALFPGFLCEAIFCNNLIRERNLKNLIPRSLSGKESACSAGDTGDVGLIPGLGRSPGGGNVTHFSILAWRIPMDRGA